MLYKIRCNPVHPLNGALPGPYVPARVTRGALVAHRHTYAPPRCVPFSTAGLLFLYRCPSGTILLSPYKRFGTDGFQEHGQSFFIALSCSIPTIVFCSFAFLFFLSIGWCCGTVVFGLIGCISLSLSLALPTVFNNNNNNKTNGKIWVFIIVYFMLTFIFREQKIIINITRYGAS